MEAALEPPAIQGPGAPVPDGPGSPQREPARDQHRPDIQVRGFQTQLNFQFTILILVF